MSNTFKKLLNEQYARNLVQVDNKKRALQFISELFANGQGDLKLQTILEHLTAREKLGSTQIGHGVALPHARIATLQQPMLALITLAKPIIYDESSRNKIDILCALLVPTSMVEQYLDTLKDLALLFQQVAFREALRAATNDTELYATATNWKTRLLAEPSLVSTGCSRTE